MLRPFKTYEEFFENCKIHGGLRYKPLFTNEYLYPSVHHNDYEKNGIGVCFNIYDGVNFIYWEDLLKLYEFNDGTKCGMAE